MSQTPRERRPDIPPSIPAPGSYLPGGIVTTWEGSYISGTGTAGADNTAQTVKALTLPANYLRQLGDRLWMRAYWRGDTGGPITGTVSLGPSGSEVAISNTTDVGTTTLQVNESWLH